MTRAPSLAHARTRLLVRLSNEDSSIKTSSCGSYWATSLTKAARLGVLRSHAAFVIYGCQKYNCLANGDVLLFSATSLLYEVLSK